MQAEELGWAQAGSDQHDRDGPEAGVELGGHGFDLLPGLEREHIAALVALALRVRDPGAGVPLHQAALETPGERLAEGAEDAVTRSGRDGLAPVLELDAAQAVRPAV